MTTDFQCPYAPRGQRRCPPSICDCFIDTYPDDPFGLHPEAFLVNGHQYTGNGHAHADTCPGCADGETGTTLPDIATRDGDPPVT